MGQKSLPRVQEPWLFNKLTKDGPKIRESVLAVLEEQGYKTGPWFFKGAKMCLIWELWRSAFPNAKWVVVRRDIGDITSSCMRTGFMSAFRNPADWETWAKAHEQRFTEMKEAGLNIREIWPQKMVDGDYTEVKEVVHDFLNLDFNVEVVKEFIDPDLWKGGK